MKLRKVFTLNDVVKINDGMINGHRQSRSFTVVPSAEVVVPFDSTEIEKTAREVMRRHLAKEEY